MAHFSPIARRGNHCGAARGLFFCRRAMRGALFFVFAASAGLASGTVQAAAGYCSSGREVMFAGLNWESGEFITALTRKILELGFDCRTASIPGNSVTLEQAVANDDVQIFAEEWVGRSDAWKKATELGQVRNVGHPFTGGSEGWYVPEYLVRGDPTRHLEPAAPGLRSVDQLADAAMVAIFRDPEQPARGRFLNCPSGWTCEGVNTAKLKAYGLAGRYVDFRPGTGPAMDAAIAAAYEQEQPLLFYSWSPSALAGRFRLVKLAEPPYSAACWADLTSAYGRHDRGCAAPEPDVAYGLSRAFAQQAPEIASFFEKATLSLADLNANLAAMSEKQRGADAQADIFLKDHPQVWQAWVTPEVASRIAAGLKGKGNPVLDAQGDARTSFPTGFTFSIRKSVNDAVAALVTRHGAGFRAISHVVLGLVLLIDNLLAWIPWWLLIAILAALTWAGSRRTGLTVTVGALMLVVGTLGLWDLMLQTLTLMLVSSLVTVLIGLPMGIWTAKSVWSKRLIWPALDVMQTMPSFVYLIPALMLFGLGKVPAIIATVIYALPPMIRLTALGIEQVDAEIKEAATSFGVTPWQMLATLELPLARPSIMAGVNQTIMLALSMVVVASMIGARGLGEQVLNGIQTLDVGQGLEAGIGIVILAVVLDRVTQGFGSARTGANGSAGQG